jgi:hypothetical protein
MITARHCLIGLAILILSHNNVDGSPIQVDLSGNVGAIPVEQSISLSDPSQPLSSVVNTMDLIPTPRPPGVSLNLTTCDFSLSVSVVTPGSALSTNAAVTVTGYVTFDPKGNYLYNMCNFSGTGTDAMLSLPPGTNPADVSSYLADLLAHPSRVSFDGQESGPADTVLTTSLTIAPPIDPSATLSVPEPSTLAVFLTGLAGLSLARRLRAFRACSARVA